MISQNNLRGVIIGLPSRIRDESEATKWLGPLALSEAHLKEGFFF